MKQLYYGDNPQALVEHIADASFALSYLGLKLANPVQGDKQR